MEIGTISAFTRSDAASIPPFDAPKRSPVFAQHVHKLAVARDPSFSTPHHVLRFSDAFLARHTLHHFPMS